MIETKSFYDYLIKNGVDSFYGVPDSLLKDICACITTHSPKEKHIITANEGNAVALAAGNYLATGKPALVYLQNSGLGNTINPLMSLTDEDVYNIPLLLLIGWRGEPGVHDEPQHVKQGKVTLEILNALGVKYLIIDENYEEQLREAISYMKKTKKAVALIVRKDTFSKFKFVQPINNFELSREDALEALLSEIDSKSVIISTTGKASRELFELREKEGQGHKQDFLTVGSMGHTSSIALGVAPNTKKTVYCIDGDGSMLMHLGSQAINAANAPKNFKYIVINNGAHESVGGQPTVALSLNFKHLFSGLGFSKIFEAKNAEGIKDVFPKFKRKQKSVLVVYVNLESRSDLGRPTTTPIENKEELMKFIKGKNK